MSENLTLDHILVVEDDASLAQWIADYLTENNYQVSIANRGDVAIQLVEEDIPDLVILDVNLPEVDGFEVCKTIRTFYANPVLMLTARGDEHDEVNGLGVGANDYLIKPVRPKALLARLQALLRHDSAALSCLNLGQLRIDADTRSVRLSDQALRLSSNEFDLLWLLASHAGEVMSREDIVSQMRGIEYDGFDRSIDILVSRVRKKLSDDSTHPFLIKTVRGKGYLFAHDA
ncbi:MAG: response regulator [Granulosicoccus sp.]